MGVGGGGPASSDSSGEEDGDAEWRAAIDSIASGSAVPSSNGPIKSNLGLVNSTLAEEDPNPKQKKGLKLYQIKVQSCSEIY